MHQTAYVLSKYMGEVISQTFLDFAHTQHTGIFLLNHIQCPSNWVTYTGILSILPAAVCKNSPSVCQVMQQCHTQAPAYLLSQILGHVDLSIRPDLPWLPITNALSLPHDCLCVTLHHTFDLKHP